jgi:glycosyltransferase involved in cell wall biosynthesis
LKISILLPTRERLEYLKLAVESVLRQDVPDWQLVISDNCSNEDIHGYVSSLADSRIVYTRTEHPVPVTENWNLALSRSDGDYVTMLGDDDALLAGYLSRMHELVHGFGEPDLIYTKSLLFTYPGVDPAHPAGFLMDHGCADFFTGAAAPFVLDRSRAIELVRSAMSFRLRFDFNAQFALISRRLVSSLEEFGDFYQSAFPDYYSMNAAFLRAERIVIEPFPRVIIGVTPKSYGYFHANQREADGRDFLDGAKAAQIAGSNINVGWLSAVTALERGIGAEFGLRVDHRRYRFVQAAYVHERYRAGATGREGVRLLERELPVLERLGYRIASAALAILQRLMPVRVRESTLRGLARLVGQLPAIAPRIVEGRHRDVIDVIEDRAKADTDRPRSA